MGKIWTVTMLLSIVCAAWKGSWGKASESFLQAGGEAVSMMVTLMGVMALWSGMMRILEASGDAGRVGRLLRRVLKPLFPESLSEESWRAMGVNIAANMMGLGNAATPAGIEAAGLLARQGDAGLRALAMLLALNNSGLQLMPTTVIALRASFGSVNPTDIWLSTLVSSGVATVVAAGLMAVISRGGARFGGYSVADGKRSHHSQGQMEGR